MQSAAMIIAVLVAAIGGIIAYRAAIRRAFLAAGRGFLMNTERLTVIGTSASSSVIGADGELVKAGDERIFVNIDCRIQIAPVRLDLDDFQLVREKGDALGEAENAGEIADESAFFWAYLDAAGAPIQLAPDDAEVFDVRLTFRVPRDVKNGYLFYWGLYWGPLGWEVE